MRQALTEREMAICRDAAWERLRQRDGREQTREVYDSLTYLNNSELVGNQWLVSKGTIKAGEEILLTKGWAWWSQVRSQAGQSGRTARPDQRE